MTRESTTRASLIAVGLACALSSFAQSDQKDHAHFDNTIRFSGSIYGAPESGTYGGIEVDHRFDKNFSLGFRYFTAKVSDYNNGLIAINRGGTAREAILRYSMFDDDCDGWGFGLGYSDWDLGWDDDDAFIDSETHQWVGTARFRFRVSDSVRASVGINSLLSPSTAVEPYVEFRQRLDKQFSISARLGYPIVGDNAVSTNTGFTQKQPLFNVGLQIKAPFGSPNERFDIGLTNELGDTTLGRMRPALGNSVGLKASFTYKF